MDRRSSLLRALRWIVAPDSPGTWLDNLTTLQIRVGPSRLGMAALSFEQEVVILSTRSKVKSWMGAKKFASVKDFGPRKLSRRAGQYRSVAV
jgi:hypothetical protein